MNNQVYVFLDFDGVLNNSLAWDFDRSPELGTKFLDHRAVKAFSKFMEKTPNSVLVASTVWRLHYSLDELTEILRSFGYTGPGFSYATPRHFGDYRGRALGRVAEIHDFLFEHSVVEYVVFDDLRLAEEVEKAYFLDSPYTLDPNRFVEVNNEVGLTYSDLDWAAGHITTEWTKPVHLF